MTIKEPNTTGCAKLSVRVERDRKNAIIRGFLSVTRARGEVARHQIAVTCSYHEAKCNVCLRKQLAVYDAGSATPRKICCRESMPFR